MENHKNCNCFLCQAQSSGLTMEQAIEKQKAYEAECLAKFGFYIHYVSDSTLPFKCNIHTHGLEASGHKDFQIILPLNPDVAHSILSNLARRVIDGEQFKAESLVEKVIHNFPIKLIESEESNRLVFRVIFPDPNGNLDRSSMNLPYSSQYYFSLNRIQG